jgi:hypothetical protein
MTKRSKLVSTLRKNRLTAKQLRQRCGYASVEAVRGVISQLRGEYRVSTTEAVIGGETVNRYKITSRLKFAA